MNYGASMGPQQGFTEGFNPIAEAQPGDGFSQQTRLNPISEFHHRASTGNQPVPAPCLPLDQSPNRAASIHGLPSSSASSENHNLENRCIVQPGNMESLDYNYPNNPPSGNFDVSVFPLETEPQLSQFANGRQVTGSNFPGNSGMQQPPGIQGHSKRQPQVASQNHGMFYEPLPGGCKMDLPRHTIMQQQTGLLGRQNSCPPSMPMPAQPETGSANAGMQEGGLMAGQHNHFEYPVGIPNTYGEHTFNMQPQLPPSHNPPGQRLQHYDPAYLNISKRRRFDFPNANRGENCVPWNSTIENHASPSTYPGMSGEFGGSDGFSPLQHVGPEQHRQNAAMMIKQMACRSQQQRLRQPSMQQLGHHGEVPQGPVVQRASAGGMTGFDRDSGRRMVNFDAQGAHMPQEGGWFSGPGPHPSHPPTDILGPRADPVIHDVHQNNALMFRPGVNGLGMQEPIRGEGRMQFGSGMGNLAQMQSPGAGAGLSSTTSGHPNDFSGQAMGAQQSFPFGGTNRQGMPQAVNTSPAGYSTQSNQHASASKLGAVSLGSLTKTASKDSVFGQSCLAALSTACQNMIASLGAPNLNVTFNKKCQTDGKRKLSQTEQDAEYFPGAGTLQSAHISVPKQGDPNQAVQGEASALSPSYNTDATPCIEGKAATGGGRGRGRRKKDTDHVSPGSFFPSENGNPVVSPCQEASEMEEKLHGSPSWGNKSDPVLDDEPDLMSSLDSGFQSLSKSAECSPRVAFEPSYAKDDVLSMLPKLPVDGQDVNHSTESYRSVGHPSTPSNTSPTSGQDDVHPLEILQAQIQLQRQQFSISEDQPLGVKKSGDGSGQSEDNELSGCSPGPEKASMDSIDLDILMAEQHAAWFVPEKGPEEDKSLAVWEKPKEEGAAKEGK